VAKAKSHPITHHVVDLPMAFVVELLVDRLCLLQAIAHISQELVPIGHALGHSRHTCVAWLIRPDGGRVATVDDSEWSVLQRRLERRVVDVLRPREPA